MAQSQFTIRLADQELFDSTCISYSEAIERGEMDMTEAQDNLEALALGMLEIV
jgi:hypothetical protein